jgi:hypothetical protein
VWGGGRGAGGFGSCDLQNAEAVQLQSLLEEVNEFVEGQAAKM